MAKRGQMARKPPTTRKRTALRKRATASIDPEKEISNLRRELLEARREQVAAAEVLKVISSSPGELEPVFQVMLENATRICEAKIGILWRYEGGAYTSVAVLGVTPAYAEYLGRGPIRAGPDTGLGRVAATKQTIRVDDILSEPAYANRDPLRVATADLGNVRSQLNVPMLKENELIGAIGIYRTEVRPFTEKQIELVSNFAKQAVVAIENVRLLNELRKSLQQQTATADVLKVISRSAFDLQTVLDTLVKSAARLCQAFDSVIFLREGEGLHLRAHYGPIPMDIADWPIGRKWVNGRAFVDRAPVHVYDLQASADEFPDGAEMALRDGHRTILVVPLLREDEAIGTLAIRRTEVKPFTEKQIELLTTFADQAVIAIENVRLFDEVNARTEDLRESLQQQTATADVLKVISRSAFDLQTVLDTLVESAVTLSGAKTGTIFQKKEGLFHLTAQYGYTAEMITYGQANPIAPGIGSNVGRTALRGKVVQIPDVLADPDFRSHGYQRIGNFRAMLGVPLMRDGRVEGVFSLAKPEPGPFTQRQVALVQTFADQAIIAIENVRLFDELQARTDDLKESLDQQTSTTEVLKIIGRSAFDLQPVFDTIAENAVKLCEAERAYIFQFDGNVLRAVASYNVGPEMKEWVYQNPIAPGRHSVSARAALERRTVQVPDVQADPEYAYASRDVDLIRTILSVPMLKGHDLVGIITIYKLEVKPFTDKQIALVETFADQAVIAIENVRLFDEVQARTEDLRESLQQQTATADVLKVISRSTFDLRAVLQTLVESAAKLCEAHYAMIFRREDDVYQLAANHGFADDYREWMQRQIIAQGRETLVGRTVLDRTTIHIPDASVDPEYTWNESIKRGGFRTMLGVPLLREGIPIGVIALCRSTVLPFTDRQIDLVTTFADQAVIAIENVRLFDEVNARTEDLRETLQQQTATADVLKVISRSTLDGKRDLESVLETLLESAIRLCDATRGHVYRYDGEFLRFAAAYGAWPGFRAWLEANPLRPSRGSIAGRAALDLRVCHVPDVLSDAEYEQHELLVHQSFRSALCVPMLREGALIGVIAIVKPKAEPFTDKQIELVSTFADQAVIAIENVRLFDEVQARTRELSQSVDELRALGEVSQAVNSTVDLQTVLNTIVSRATQLSGTDAGAIYVYDQTAQDFHLRATYGMDDAIIAEIKDRRIQLGETAIGEAVEQRIPLQIPDIQEDLNSPVLDIIVRAGFRALLILPLLSADRTIGALVVRRKQPGEFPKHTVDLLQTFAAQSVLAIQNARLFENVEARTRDLAKSLEELRTAQDRLIQTEKLASLGQLTAGIAHEIKNPLNFVNNFSALSVELVEELHDVLKPARLDNKTREETSELTNLLKGNLEKVVQHGQRANSIVKNMLLHSREGSGERRPVDLNAIVEDSLNLAYHGARAEKQEFSIQLERSFDPAAGQADLFPQEITRVLLNLISNGVYAAMKRKAEMRDGYEPTLAAATADLGDRVEIRIRDNGGGIPPQVREKIFNPFFTTKPPGEGTGLGLSLSHDIVVKQHGGSIEVDTRPGEFTEFRIVLPRTAATSKAGAGT